MPVGPSARNGPASGPERAADDRTNRAAVCRPARGAGCLSGHGAGYWIVIAQVPHRLAYVVMQPVARNTGIFRHRGVRYARRHYGADDR
jgi:hypothetical protein